MRQTIVTLVTLWIICCCFFSCAPQQKPIQQDAGGPEQVAGISPADPLPEESTGQSVQTQTGDIKALQKIEEFFETFPPEVIKETGLRQQPDSSDIDESAAVFPPTSFQIIESDIQVPPILEDPTPLSPPEALGSQDVGLNFDNADIHDVTKVVSEITGKSFIVDSDVEGTVTIYSETSLSPEQVFELFKSVLELNGLAIAQIGDFYKIVKSEKAQKGYLSVDSKTFPAVEDRLVTQIVKLKYVRAREVKAALTGLTSSEIIVYPDEEGSTLIITDLASNVRKLLAIIKEMDVSQYANQYVEVIPIEHADLQDLIEDLYQILAIPGAAGPVEEMVTQPVEPTEPAEPETTQEPVSPVVPPGTKTTLYPITRLNALMVSTNNPDVITLVKKWVNILDQPSSRDGLEKEITTGQINYVYPVKYAKAKDLAEILAEVYAEGVQPLEPVEPEPDQPDQQQQQQPTPQLTNNPEEPAPVFIPDETTNSLIIRATPTQYAQINALLEKLDQRPLQVLIDVIIAEVQLADTDIFGVKGMLQSEGQLTIGGETNAVNATAQTDFAGISGDGFNYVINAPGRFMAQLRALATESRVKVLSDPHILVRNNQQAKINIGDSIPITTVRTVGDEEETTVEYKETGIILTVTPQINFEGDVVMEIVQEVSTPGTKETGEVAPPINKTTAETFLLTQDGHPLVIGGLIKTTDSKTAQGVPLLKDIPLLGRLFRYNEKQSNRKELLILVTPRIVRTPEQGWTLTDDMLQKRLKRLEQLFNREETDPEKVKRFLQRQFNPEEEQP